MSYRGPVTTNLDPVINYISNGRAYDSTIGWATYADAAGAQPVDGTGGSPNVTWSRDTTSPLRQGADFNLVKDAVNRQGQGVSYDFTIDSADLAKVLTVTFDYEVLSGTYATGDLTVYLVQDTGGTPTVIQPAGYQIQSATVGTKMRQIATFQTSSSITSYRLCLHVASTSASAYSLAVDNVVVGPQVVQYGAPVTDWQSYTPTFTGFGTVSTQTFWWRREGDSVLIKGRFTSGTSTAVEARISLPSGFTSDSTKVNGTIEVAGFFQSGDSGVVAQGVGASISVLVEPSVNYVTFSTRNSANSGLTKLLGTNLAANGVSYSFTAQVPILGWSSSVQMSNDTDTRVVDMQVNAATAITPSGTIGTNFATSTTINFNKTPVKDTHGGYSAGVYTTPVAGDYFVASRIEMAHTNSTGTFIALSVAVNGVEKVTQGIKTSTTNAYAFVSGLVTGLNAGDLITIRIYSDASAKAFTSSVVNDFTVHRLSGPSAIAASESVNAKYTISTATQAPGALTQFNFDNRVFDSHGAVTTGAGAWRFTAPVSGTYTVLSQLYASSGNSDIWLYVNGTSNTIMAHVNTAATPLSGATMVRLNAGEYIDIRPQAAITVAGGSTPYKSHVSIAKVGN